MWVFDFFYSWKVWFQGFWSTCRSAWAHFIACFFALGIFWIINSNVNISNEEAQIRVDVERPSIHLSRESLRWTWHILRSEDRVLSEVLTFVPSGGKRGWGRPRVRFYDTIKADLKNRNIPIDTKKQSTFWDALTVWTKDRSCWRKEVVNARRS